LKYRRRAYIFQTFPRLKVPVMRMLVVQVEGIDIFEGLKDRPFPFTGKPCQSDLDDTLIWTLQNMLKGLIQPIEDLTKCVKAPCTTQLGTLQNM
jgi:hypothetical protein